MIEFCLTNLGFLRLRRHFRYIRVSSEDQNEDRQLVAMRNKVYR